MYSCTALSGGSLTQRSISADRIVAGAITTDKLAAESVDASKIKAGSITTAQVTSNFGEALDNSSNEAVLTRVSGADLSEAITGMDEQLSQIADGILEQIAVKYAVTGDLTALRAYCNRWSNRPRRRSARSYHRQ